MMLSVFELVIVFVTLSSLMCLQCSALPRGFNLAQLEQLAKTHELKGSKQVKYLGDLSSLHVVGLTSHPTDDDKLIYADETALYEFNKVTGDSIRLAGGESFGLLADRKSVDGKGAEAKFKYITKVVMRPTAVYVFDYDMLRKYTVSDQMVKTVTTLFDDDWLEEGPITGVVNEAEDTVYFTTIEGYGHFVMKLSIPNGKLSEAEMITAGPSLIGSMVLSDDEQYLMMGDVTVMAVQKVKLSNGDESELNFDSSSFYPGVMKMLDNHNLVVINSEKKSLLRYDLTSTAAVAEPICDQTCLSEVHNPLDVVVDREEQALYVLDASNHPTLPTYEFSIKQVKLRPAEETTASTTTSTTTQSSMGVMHSRGLSDMMKFYSRWLSLNKSHMKI